MVYTDFEHSVSFRRDSTSPLTVELTCTNVLRRRIHLFTDETKTFSLPAEQTIDHHTSFIPLNELTSSPDTQHNVVYDIVRSPDETTVISRQSKITNNYSLGNGCSTILREIDMAITSSSSRGRGVVESKKCKIKTEIYKANKAAEKLLIDSYGPTVITQTNQRRRRMNALFAWKITRKDQ
ncbi:unnamed protein product [Arabidopsis lyrata]|nr:unnamed protein product [Arabidopsis lyrata]